MYDWLADEICHVKWKSFHELSSLAAAEQHPRLPSSYVSFLKRFGSAKLYRKANYYKVGVYPKIEPVLQNGLSLLCFGHYDGAKACFRESDLRADSKESPVFEMQEHGLEYAAEGFEDWLKIRCAAARASYTKPEWERVLQGPVPFTAEEQEIVRARQSFSWRLLGVAPGGSLKFEISNRSHRSLNYLSIGIRAKDNRFFGGLYLDVRHIPPASTGIVVKRAYERISTPDDLEPFDLPNPTPEERDRYWEFRSK